VLFGNTAEYAVGLTVTVGGSETVATLVHAFVFEYPTEVTFRDAFFVPGVVYDFVTLVVMPISTPGMPVVVSVQT